MKLKTQFTLAIIFFGLVLLLSSASVLLTDQWADRLREQQEIAIEIERDASELSYLSNAYLVDVESWQLDRWESKWSSVSKKLSDFERGDGEQQVIVKGIRTDLQELKSVFGNVVSNIEKRPKDQDPQLTQDFIDVSSGRIDVQTRGIVFDAALLSLGLGDQIDRLKAVHAVLLYIFLGIMGTYLITNVLIVSRRILRSISDFIAQAKTVGAGNLDTAIEVRSHDEIGQLASAFNQMTSDLKDVTASKKELEAEITQREKVEKQLRQQEKRYHTTLDNMLEGCQIIGFDWRYLYLNDAAAEQGRYPKAALLGHTMMEMYPGIRDTPLFGLLEQCMEDRITRRVENEFVYPDGSKAWFELSIQPAPEGIFIVSLDITERKRADQIKEEFIGMVSHELKTPLTVITGALAVATEEAMEPAAAKELVLDAARHADILADIIDNLLELSRYQSKRLTLTTQNTDVKPIAQEVIRKAQIMSSMHELTLDIPEDTPIVAIDPIRVERVLHNLVENAIKYSPSGGEVRVSAHQQNNELVVSVSDEGIGISAKDVDTLFQSFRRLAAETTHLVPGVGLGLRVCKILVEAHGGRIWVESIEGRGTTFFFTVPIAAISDEAHA